jgi:hypothetical protein
MGDKANAIIGTLVILCIAVAWAGYEVYRLNAAIQPIANSPLVTAVSGLGRA